MIQAVIFDCFGVIYVDTSQAVFRFLQKTLNPAQQAQYQQILDECCLSQISRHAAARRLAELAGVSPKQWQALVARLNGKDIQMIELIRRVRRAGYKTGLLSNAAKHQISELFSVAERRELFDAVAVSGDIGYIKPAVEAYQTVLDKLGVAAEQSLLIDDNLSYCQAAQQLGMRTIHYRSLPQLKQQLIKLLPDHRF